jgi:hypothetical protein
MKGGVVDEELKRIMGLLLAPFDRTEVKFKPAVINGNRALALPYVDSRTIQDRLDEVLGISGWQDEYECLPDGSVICRLRCKIGNEWITKTDVGGQSEQPDEGDRRKAAFSDALKRAAVKFGVGRYLYRLPQMWVDYDPQKRQFVKPPRLPDSALPAVSKTQPADASATRTAPPEAAKAEPVDAATGVRTMPQTGVELQKRLYDHDASLAKEGVIRPGDLVRFIVQKVVLSGGDGDIGSWSQAQIKLAVVETKLFEAEKRAGSKPASTTKKSGNGHKATAAN